VQVLYIYSTVEGTFFGFFFSIEKIVKKFLFSIKKGPKKETVVVSMPSNL
jgi:hypothetical protein